MTSKELEILLNDKENWELFEDLVNDNKLKHLPTADLSFADLSKVNLVNANLDSTVLGDRMIISNGELSQEELRKVLNVKSNWKLFEKLLNNQDNLYNKLDYFKGADFGRVKFKCTNLEYAVFEDVNMNYAQIDGAKTEHASAYNLTTPIKWVK